MSAEMTLPEEWVETNLGRILELKYGKSLPDKSRDGIGFPVYGSNGKVGLHSQAFVNKEGIIVGRKGSYGEVQYSATPFSPIDTTYFIDEYWNQPISFWFYQLKKLPLTSLNRSTAIPGLNREDAYEQKVALPPLAEQHQIAQRLDELLAQVDTIKARLDAIPAILKRFRQSVLSAAVSGKLTEASLDTKNQWPEAKLSQLCLSISDGDHQAPPKSEHGVPFVVISDISSGKLNIETVERKVLPEYYSGLKNIRKPEEHDVLYSVTGSFGIPVIVNTDADFCFQRHIAILKPNHEIINFKFLYFCLLSDQTYKQAEKIATGTAQKTVPLTGLREIKIPNPSIKKQNEIVHRIDQFFTFADQIEQRVNDAKSRVDKLTQSILAKAFRGELTADWRAEHPELISGENSAEALLAKIQAAKEALGGKKKKGKAA